MRRDMEDAIDLALTYVLSLLALAVTLAVALQ